MGHQEARRWTALEFLALPEKDRHTERMELIDGRLVVTSSPKIWHQRVVQRFFKALSPHVEATGGEVFCVSVDVLIDEDTVLVPDVQVFLAGHTDRLGTQYADGPPDLVIEVSSPSTRGRDRLVKRALYERFGVAEYWIVDLEEQVIEAYRLEDSGFGEPVVFRKADAIVTPLLPGWSAEVGQLLTPPD